METILVVGTRPVWTRGAVNYPLFWGPPYYFDLSFADTAPPKAIAFDIPNQFTLIGSRFSCKKRLAVSLEPPGGERDLILFCFYHQLYKNYAAPAARAHTTSLEVRAGAL